MNVAHSRIGGNPMLSSPDVAREIPACTGMSGKWGAGMRGNGARGYVRPSLIPLHALPNSIGQPSTGSFGTIRRERGAPDPGLMFG